MASRLRKIIGSLFILLAALFFTYVAYDAVPRTDPIVFSEKRLLSALWEGYKREYLEEGTLRTLDKQREFITTSEGQSYTMLRAVWMDDHEVFDRSLSWTRDNLGRKSDKLFSWLFGKRADGSYGILTDRGGMNTASDADTDIALALAIAYGRWKDPKYLEEAKAIIEDIWKNEVIVIKGKPYLTANNLEKNAPASAILNPSYFAPYAYRIFKRIDPDHDWLALVDTSYEVIFESLENPLDKEKSAGLPPDWVTIGKRTGALGADLTSGLSTNYSFDALRLPFRLALDYIWWKEPRAKEALSMMSFLGEEWRKERAIYSVYSHDGRVLERTETPAMYAGSLGYFIVAEPQMAEEIYEKKIQSLYDPNTENLRQKLGYYDDNWTWFATALMQGALHNFYD